jgi:hypothetical protein
MSWAEVANNAAECAMWVGVAWAVAWTLRGHR